MCPSPVRALAPVALLFLFACGGNSPLGNGFTAVDNSVCASGSQWTAGNAESGLMNPGQDCVACHNRDREAPSLAIGGTVYRSLDEKDDCTGLAALSVVLTGADGKVHTLTTDASGNFYSRLAIALPYTAKVVDANGGERAMAASQTEGGCNSCHTATGASGAPGRIVAP